MKKELIAGPLDSLCLLPEGFDPAAGHPLVVLLHGYGADMNDLADLAPLLHPTGYVYLLPNAPLPAFVGQDPTARAWFERGGEETAEGVALACARLQAMLAQVWQRYGTPPGRTVLIGFSQGGNLALRHGLGNPDVFAGLAVLAGSLRKLDDLTGSLPTTRNQRLFIAHGYRDMTVPYSVGRDLNDYLTRQGYRPEFHSYTMAHSITRPVVEDLRRWLMGTIKPFRPAGDDS